MTINSDQQPKHSKPVMSMFGVTGTIKQQSKMHAIEITIPYIQLEERFSEYWDQVKDILPPEIVKAATKGGFREVSRKRVVMVAGGQSKFFTPVLGDVINAYLDTQPKQALILSSIELVETESRDYAIRALAYLEPEITWKKMPGIDSPIVVKIPKQPDGWMSGAVDEYIKNRQENSVILVPVIDDATPLTDGHVLLLDCQSVVDGKLWEQGCFKNKKWPMDKQYYKQLDMYDNILGMKKGEDKSFSFILNDTYGEDSGKTVQALVRINQLYVKEISKIDDDLAKCNGFNTVDAWRTGIEVEIQRKLDQQRDEIVEMNVMSSIVNTDTVDVEPIPFNWMKEKAKEIYGQMRSKVASEQDLIDKFVGMRTATGEEIKDKNTILTFLGEKSAQSLIYDLVLRSWGKKNGVEGNTAISNIGEYVIKVKEKLYSMVSIEEFAIDLKG